MNHRCDERSIDYSRVENGHVHCTVCWRTWTLTRDGWVMDPREPAPGRPARVHS